MPNPLYYLSLNVAAAGGGPGGGYSFHRSITIDRTKVPNTDQTDFPVLFSGTYTWLKTVANGGQVENANGYDIVFTSDSAGTNQLDHEIESYNATTGAVNLWVKVPTVATGSDTVIYIWYGNSSISSSQEDINGVWSNNFTLVAHLTDGTTLEASDSTSNNATPTITGAVAGSGKIDGAVSFDGANDNVSYPDSAALNPTAAISVSLWFNRSSIGSLMALIIKGDAASHANSAYEMIFSSSDLIQFEVNSGSGWKTAQPGTPTFNDTGVWHQAFGTFDGSNVKVYTDGVLRDTLAYTGSINNDTNALRLAEAVNGSFDYAGLLDEVRIASVGRSADWITTEYNNQNSPSTFYSVSGEL